MSGSGQSASLRDSFIASTESAPAHKDRRTPPVSIRFGDQERALLEEHADGEPLGPFVKRVVMSLLSGKQPKGRKRESARDQAVARALRGLGTSGVYKALSSQLLAFEEGRLNLERQQECDLRAALAGVIAIRGYLLAALGQRDGSARI